MSKSDEARRPNFSPEVLAKMRELGAGEINMDLEDNDITTTSMVLSETYFVPTQLTARGTLI